MSAPLSPLATPRPLEGAVSWNMNTTCNYRCSYCTQRFKDDRGRWARDVDSYIEFFATLPGRFEIKLSGGEPFVHPRLEDVVRGIARAGHNVSVVTNFSADRAKLEAFLEAAGPSLRVFSASLHLEYVSDLDAWLEKAAWLKGRFPEGASWNATCVATRAFLPRLPEIAARHAERGLAFKIQPEKQASRVIDYSEEEKERLLALGGHNGTGEVAASFQGLPCWAGSRYFILDDLGNAFRCYPARRQKRERLGNVLDGSFRLRDEPFACGYSYCSCTVPIERGMMPRSQGVTVSEGDQ
ncbi:radical SAM protein [bacterium]|nr:radical SAM protein [bacterium]